MADCRSSPQSIHQPVRPMGTASKGGMQASRVRRGPGDVAVEERLAEEADEVAEGLEEHRRDPADGAGLLRYQQHLERAEAPRIGAQGQWAKPHSSPILRRGPVAHRGFCSRSGVACGVRRASKRRCVD